MKLDSCSVQVEPQLNDDMEHLRLPDNLLKQLSIQSESTTGGLVLSGKMNDSSVKFDWSIKVLVHMTIEALLIV